MTNSVRKKIRLGTLFLFLLLLLLGGVSIYHINRLKNDSKEILKDNYESLDYGHSLLILVDKLNREQLPVMNAFDSLLKKQEANITEDGEADLTAGIRQYYDRYVSGNDTLLAAQAIRDNIQQILKLNMASIESKNTRAGMTAENALTYISLIAAVILLVGFTFSYNFPSVLTDPINSLTEGLEEIARKNYQHRIHLERKDEFGQMAEAFNKMAERLEYFENSNLNKIIFEKARAEAVINSLKEASIGIDKNDQILFANDQALQLLSMPAKDLLGMPVEEVRKRNDLFRFLLEEKGSMPFKIVIDNRENYFTKEIMEISQGDTQSKVIVLRNITSFKELDVAKTNFIATISHELKTPLASSDFGLKLLEDDRVGSLSDEQRELIQQLKADNQRMLRILSELLNMAQVEEGKIQLNISTVRAEDLVEMAVQAVSGAAREKKITIGQQYTIRNGMIRADAERTGWVLNNFLTNAIKHSPEESGILVEVKQKGTEIEISVTDQGPGIPSEYSTKVFERFFKVPGSKAGGTGLGLAISKEFIQAEGGHIWVNTEIGSGSQFGFSLPLAGEG